MAFALLFLLTSTLASFVRAGSIFTSPAQVTKQYDFIIVGAGTAGSVIAARLSEAASVKVLVIEAGGSDNATDSIFDTIYAPVLAGTGGGTTLDWNYTTVAQSGLNGRTIPVPRGRVLGGSSAINGMIYSRGSADEYNRLASVSGDSGWQWSNLRQYIMKNEQHTPPWNYRSNTGEYIPAWHGTGPLLTGLTPTPYELDNRVIQNTQTYPSTYPFNMDFNSGNGIGYGWLETSVGNGMRSTSASAYLHPALNQRSNLDVLINTQVTKLVIPSTKIARTIQVAQSASSATFTFHASKEVILCAGAIGTPQILMLSGIGPKSELLSLGIPTIVDAADVGRNLQDQTILSIQWEVQPNFTTLGPFLGNPVAVGEALEQWAANRTGMGAGNYVVNTIGFARLPSSSPLLASGDPSAGSNSPHFQLAFMNFFYPNPGQSTPTTGNWNSVCLVLSSPKSVGSLNITSTSAFTHPTINPAYYSDAGGFDIGVAVAAMNTAASFFSTSVFADYFIGPYPETAAALASTAAAEAYVRQYSNSLDHPTSTARISKSTDKTGVVGPSLLVKGLTGLRIVDASILPAAPAGFPQAEVYIIAERAADLIKSAWNL